MNFTTDEAVIRLFIAVLFGSIVGIERELTQKSAGLRTHILVCLGSTVFTLLSISIMSNHGDPGRIAAQIVTGIGFIGGGAVLRNGSSVQGLTTAASLWVMAAIGMLVATGHYRLAAVTTLLAFLVLFSIGNLERLVFQKNLRSLNRLKVILKVDRHSSESLQRWLDKQFGADMLNLKVSNHSDNQIQTIILILNMTTVSQSVSELSVTLQKHAGIRQYELTLLENDGL